ncbi:DUF2357 domain-containing protein [Thermoanaerobacterium butyriciformans]|uniref:Component of viral defense system (DUF524 family) n=1 Tax=Thermoanaerobacterium butyriciformans TaxID=1702242 RepID=A0ABS4NJZ6_9THEO|nr:DUF2357 domain-containing protein [Thermoanaerobacterium butyriciformans]MBP2073373.1 putative component of viral defense system (DUF524 family) [Thermoanaerobacterium butyriciformans]
MRKMVSHLTGSDIELLNIWTPKFYFTIKGSLKDPNMMKLDINKGVKSRVKISCRDEYTAEVYSQELGKTVQLFYEIDPLFFEQQNYEIVIEKISECDIEFYHDNINIRNKVSPVGRAKKVLTGVVNFTNDIGLSDLIIKVDGKEYLRVEIEVYPSKIDYLNDYNEILKDINNELYNLIFDFYKKTYLLTGLRDTVGNSLTEFFAIINLIFDRLDRAIGIVLRMPHHVLAKERVAENNYKVKRVDNECIKWINRHQQYVKASSGVIEVEKALSLKNTVTFDTFENRIIKYMIKSVINRLRMLKKRYTGRSDNGTAIVDRDIVDKIDMMIAKLDKHISTTFLKDVGDIYTMNSLSLVLNMAAGYREVYKYYIMLLKGLMMKESFIKISTKNMALLYEYWCFIKLNSLLRHKYDLVRQDIIKFDNSGLSVKIKMGDKARVEYQNPKNGERYFLAYNNKYGDTATVAQKPDNALSLEKKGSNVKYNYIFDAKYRICYDNDYLKRYFTPGPEEDDINTMHRYRDAIVYENKDNHNFERMFFGAFVLFPYSKEDEYRNHQFYKSIEKVGVGGLPFLPNATHLVEDLLDDVIDNSPETAFENTVLQHGMYEYLDKIEFNEKEVLVGNLSSHKQLEVNLKYKFYHIPYSEIRSSLKYIKYVAIAQTKAKGFGDDAGIRYYGRVKSFEILRRSEIKEIPKDSEELYVKFTVDKWEKLDKKIDLAGRRVLHRFYTNLFLLKNAKIVSELLIKTKEDYRLYLELKRLDEIKVELNKDDVDDDTMATGIELNGLKIYINDGFYRVYKGKDLVDNINVDDFRKRPNIVIKRIKSHVK